MSVRSVDNTPIFLSNTRRKASTALRFMLDAIDTESTPHTPKKTGDLRNRKLKQVLGLTARITWGTNYAGWQETKQFANYTTPGTGPHFAEDAVNKVLDDAPKYFRKAGIRR
ncbi:hypothetical protein DVS77_21565 [Mycolicibacterium moriokaense]|nr:hypothetical protein DVS77_21565 [Mycolicibacterium moriokaense]